MINIIDEGAYNDGTHETTNTTVLNATLRNDTKSNVYFPQGNYLLDGALNWNTGGYRKLIGDGMENTIIKTAGAFNLFSPLGSGSFLLQDLRLDGNSVGLAAVYINTADAGSKPSQFFMKRCKVHDFVNAGFDQPNVSSLVIPQFEENHFIGNGPYGIKLYKALVPRIRYNRFANHTVYDLLISKNNVNNASINVLLEGNIYDGGGAGGLHIDFAYGVTCIHEYFEEKSAKDCYIKSVNDLNWIGGNFYPGASGQIAMHLEGCTGFNIQLPDISTPYAVARMKIENCDRGKIDWLPGSGNVPDNIVWAGVNNNICFFDYESGKYIALCNG